ncbi:hypothetical protein AAVH_21109 [Aphelenchoides avenae]|nr:hypothetical protein AAVH_21109 [Aphelenchus avenae]
MLSSVKKSENLNQVDEAFTSRMWRYGQWIIAAKQNGVFAYEEVPPVFVGPGVDPETEDLRAVLGLLEQRGATISEDPQDERRTLADLFNRHLHDLAAVATKKAVLLQNDDLLHKVRLLNALFRLSFRKPAEMRFTDADRSLVVSYIDDSIAHVRRRVEAGDLSPAVSEALADMLFETAEQMLEWHLSRQDHQRHHQEL